MLWWLCGSRSLQPNCSPKHGQPYGEGQNKIDESESLLENGAAATANNVLSSVNLYKSNYLGKMLPTFGGNINKRDELCHNGNKYPTANYYSQFIVNGCVTCATVIWQQLLQTTTVRMTFTDI